MMRTVRQYLYFVPNLLHMIFGEQRALEVLLLVVQVVKVAPILWILFQLSFTLLSSSLLLMDMWERASIIRRVYLQLRYKPHMNMSLICCGTWSL